MAKRMDGMLPGESGYIHKVHGDGPVKRRLVDMGLVAGTSVKVLKYAPLGDPIELKVKGFNLSLRRSEAALVEIVAD